MVRNDMTPVNWNAQFSSFTSLSNPELAKFGLIQACSTHFLLFQPFRWRWVAFQRLPGSREKLLARKNGEPLSHIFVAMDVHGVPWSKHRRVSLPPFGAKKENWSSEQNTGWVVVSNIFYFHPYLGKIPILTIIFERGWNHQLAGYVHFLKLT